MKRLLLAILVLLVTLTCALAAGVFGSIKDASGRPIGQNYTVEVRYGQGRSAPSTIDRNGAYSIYVDHTGRMQFILKGAGGIPVASNTVYSLTTPVRHDFILHCTSTKTNLTRSGQ